MSGWEVETVGGFFPRRQTPLAKALIIWPQYLLVPVRLLLGARRCDRVICWQQVYGIALALAIRELRLRTDLQMDILALILTPAKRRGLWRRLIGFALNCRNVRTVVVYNDAELGSTGAFSQRLHTSSSRPSTRQLTYHSYLTTQSWMKASI